MNRDRICRHCGSPARQNPCWYHGGRDFDPPCFDDEYERGMKILRRRFGFWLLMIVLSVVLCAAALGALASRAKAEDNPGAWWRTPAVQACCSEADAVWADEWHMLPGGRVIAKVTGGGPRNHQWAPIGRLYEVPADRVLREHGNPTGRPLLFIRQGDHHLYCFALGPLG